ncbi:MAG: hypothetical protein MJ087_06520 [Lachnospiraceae bacterium]|nr:hypothetical protein [Lachnospiraceae bacterium]
MNNNKFSGKMKSLIALAAVVLLSSVGVNVADIDLPFISDNDTKIEQTVDNNNQQETSDEDVAGEDISDESQAAIEYEFKNDQLLKQHWDKHGDEFDYDTIDEYVAGANRVINSKDALHKLEKEDGDDVYYLEDSNEFVIVSTNGYIRTYFKPSSGKRYFDKQ